MPKKSNSKVGNARTIVKRLAELAADEDSRSLIVKDGGCLAGVVKYLKHKDAVVHTLATQTVKLLASSPEIRAKLCEQKGLVNNLIHVQSLGDPRAQNIATMTLSILKTHINKEDTLFPTNVESKSALGMSATTAASANTNPSENTAPSESDNTLNQQRSSQSIKSMAAAVKRTKTIIHEKRKVRTTTLKITGMEEDSKRTAIERSLIRLKGVVSVTLDRRRRRAIVVTRSAEDMSQDLIASISTVEGVSATLRKKKRKVKSATEKKKTNDTSGGYLDSENQSGNAGGGYLDDEDDEDIYGPGVVSKFGAGSLQSQLAAMRLKDEQKKKEKERQEKAQGYIAKVSNAIGWGASWLGV